ncbi:MAG: hypothetical protein K8L97_31575 [Anaerolineae bacterium]|nr:hypothetical protein [Anaerolineae bacterium]
MVRKIRQFQNGIFESEGARWIAKFAAIAIAKRVCAQKVAAAMSVAEDGFDGDNTELVRFTNFCKFCNCAGRFCASYALVAAAAMAAWRKGFRRHWGIVVGVVVFVGWGVSDNYELIMCEKCGKCDRGFCADFARSALGEACARYCVPTE